MPDAWLGRLAPSSLLLPRPKLPFQGEGSGTTELLALTICGKPDVIQFHFMLGKTLLAEIKKPNAPRNGPTPTSSKLDEAAAKRADEVLEMLGTSAAGLSEDEAAARLEEYGPNEVAHEEKEGWFHRLYVSARNPLVILLTVLAILSYSTGDFAPARS